MNVWIIVSVVFFFFVENGFKDIYVVVFIRGVRLLLIVIKFFMINIIEIGELL